MSNIKIKIHTDIRLRVIWGCDFEIVMKLVEVVTTYSTDGLIRPERFRITDAFVSLAQARGLEWDQEYTTAYYLLTVDEEIRSLTHKHIGSLISHQYVKKKILIIL